jgi:hypothetical protein
MKTSPLMFPPVWPDEFRFTAKDQYSLLSMPDLIPLEPTAPPRCPGRSCLLNGQPHQHAGGTQ